MGTRSIPEPYRLPILRRLAQDGDAYAMYALSCAMPRRKGGRADPASMRWLRRAARTLPLAQVEMANRLSPDGFGWRWTPRTDPWWRKAARARHPDAMHMVALRWLPHRGNPDRRRRARVQLERAERAGSDQAAFDLATRVETLAGDLDVVERWLQAASVCNCHDEQGDLELELVGRARPFLRRLAARPIGDWRARARAGDLDAAVHLAYAQRFGRGVPYAPVAAVRAFDRAARRGSSDAWLALALHVFDDETLTYDIDAKAAAAQVAATGDPVALWVAGLIVRYRSAAEDRRRARWFESAARRGHAPAAYELARAYKDGVGVRRSPRRALQFARLAAEGGHDAGMTRLADLLMGGAGVPANRREAVRWLRRAAAVDSPDAATDLGVCLHEGRGVRRDDREAVRWYRRAAAQGCPSATANLGRCYWKGHGVRKDLHVAARWLRRATDVFENAGAAEFLGRKYEGGELGREDPVRAAIWHRRAAAMGDPEGLGSLGAFHHAGTHVVRDFEFAVLLYRAGAAKGDGWSAYCLGLCYRDGEGVRRNRGVARRWFRIAIERKVPEARKALAALRKRRVATARRSAARTTTGRRRARRASPSRARGP